MPKPPDGGGPTIVLLEWYQLGCRLAELNSSVFLELLRALRAAVEAQEALSSFDWNTFLRGRHKA